MKDLLQVEVDESAFDHLNFFDRINIAHCAIERARNYVGNQDRFNGEYSTAKMWSRYRCYITRNYSYIEN